MNLKPLLERTPDGRWLLRLNNSFYSREHSSCPRAQYYGLIAGLRDPSVNSMAHYGTCAHLAWQKWAVGCSVEDCIQSAVDEMLKMDCNTDFRNPTHLEKTLIAWFGEFGADWPVVASNISFPSDKASVVELSSAVKPLVEYQWQFPIYSDSFAVVMLQGTIDLVHLVDDKPRVRDYKTTADRDPDKKLEELLTSTQFLTYELGMRECLGITDATYEICGVFLRQDKNGKSASEFKSSRILSFENEEGRRRVEQHRENLENFASDLVHKLALFESGAKLIAFPEDYRPCNQGWGCPYRGITNATSVSDKEFIAANSFDKKPFDAHKHNEK